MSLLMDRGAFAQVTPSNVEQLKGEAKAAIIEGLDCFREEHKKLVDAGVDSELSVNIVGLALFGHMWNRIATSQWVESRNPKYTD